jgi:hypothetical protein
MAQKTERTSLNLPKVVELDDTNLNLEKLGNLEALLPTSSELQIIKQYRGPVTDLGVAEQVGVVMVMMMMMMMMMMMPVVVMVMVMSFPLRAST